MNGLPKIGSHVRLNATAHARLNKSTGRSREEGLTGQVIAHVGPKAQISWGAGIPPENIHPTHLEPVT